MILLSPKNYFVKSTLYNITVWRITRKRDSPITLKTFPWNQLFSNTSLVKTLIWRKNVDFCAKIVISFYSTFPQHCEYFAKFPWNQLFSNFLSKNIALTEKLWIFCKKWSCFWGFFSQSTGNLDFNLVSRNHFEMGIKFPNSQCDIFTNSLSLGNFFVKSCCNFSWNLFHKTEHFKW